MRFSYMCKKLLIFCMFIAAFGAFIPKYADAKKIKLNTKSINIYVGKKKQLKLSGANKASVKWKSSAKKKVSVSKKGIIRALKPGSVKITAVYKKKKYVCKVKSGNHATKIVVNTNSPTIIYVGDDYKIDAKIKGNNLLYKGYTLKSSDKSKVTVNNNTIHGVSQGDCEVQIISNSTAKNGKKITAKVKVYVHSKVSVNHISLPKKTAKVKEIYTTVTKAAVDIELDNCMNNLFYPSNGVLKARLFVEDGEKTYTIYLLDKDYNNNISLNVFSKDLSSSRSLSELIKIILISQDASYTLSYPDKKSGLYLEDNKGDCRVTDIVDNALTKNQVQFTLYETETYVNKYACIVADGDVRDVVVVK